MNFYHLVVLLTTVRYHCYVCSWVEVVVRCVKSDH